MKAMPLSRELLCAIEQMQPQTVELIKTLCAIPAPSHHEERRAAFIRDWFERRGMHAQIDEALNVLCPVGLDRHEDMVVIMAHTDTVFPDMEPMPLREENGRMIRLIFVSAVPCGADALTLHVHGKAVWALPSELDQYAFCPGDRAFLGRGLL